MIVRVVLICLLEIDRSDYIHKGYLSLINVKKQEN